MSELNRQLILRERPTGEVSDDCFELVSHPVERPADGQILVRNIWLAFEPAQRGWLNDIASYTPPVAIGAVMRSWGLGQVIESRHPAFPVGRLVHGTLDWQEWCTVDAKADECDVELVPDDIADPRWILSVAGVTGMTAYFGMTEVARPGPGDVVLVTAAAGATGSVAGQIARLLGAERVIGTAGSPTKQAWVTEVAGFDDCIGHHAEHVRRLLRQASPTGYDAVFDNVGGALLDAALFNIAEHGRIALCGSISTGYRPERPAIGLHYYQLLTTRRARMEGFLLFDFASRFDEARRALLGWAADGSIAVQHDELEGLERAPEGLRRLFQGGNLGKQLVRVGEVQS
jgi:NADPH-dependent curcumin reductase CurA